jgi:ankyrin repeat protein
MTRSPLLALVLATTLLSGCASRREREALASAGIPFTPASFIAAVRDGQTETVRRFLRAGMSADTRDAETRTALMWAADLGHDEIVATLLDARAAVNAGIRPAHLINIPFWTGRRENERMNALMFAIRARHAGIVRRLIAAGADLKVQDPRGSSGMVDLAIMSGDREMVRMLLEAGAALDARDNTGRTALFVAAQTGDPEMVRMVLARRVDVNARSRTPSTTPLVVAVQAGSAEIVRLLLQAGADPNVTDHYGKSPAVYANEANRPDIAELLRGSGGSDAGVRESRLLAAVSEGDENAVADLLREGADPNARYSNQEMGQTALILAAGHGETEAVRMLLRAGANANAGDAIGSTALHAAAHKGAVDAIDELLRAGARPSMADRNHWTPILQAAHSGHAEAIRALVRGGAGVEERTHDGATPLIVAARGGDVMAREPMNVEAAAALRDLGANVDAADERGVTPLIAAVQHRRLEMIAFLLEANADLQARTRDGQTALAIAIARRFEDAEKLLRDAGANQ